MEPSRLLREIRAHRAQLLSSNQIEAVLSARMQVMISPEEEEAQVCQVLPCSLWMRSEGKEGLRSSVQGGTG